MFEPFYSIEADFDKHSIILGVDGSFFSMQFEDVLNFNPVITPGDHKSTFLFYNIYEGIDIRYDFKEDNIKETIIIKNGSAKKSFSVKIKCKNCSIVFDKSDQMYRIIDTEENRLFTIEEPYVMEGRRKSTLLRNFVKMLVKNDSLFYSFNHSDVKKYPVNVDPSFVFNTNYQNSGEIIRDDFDSRNIMLVTSQTYGDNFLQEIQDLEEDENNNVHKLSDDVVFENGVRLYFPWILSGGTKEVKIIVEKGKEKKRFSETLNPVIQEFTLAGIPIDYSYTDIDLSFSNSGTIKISCYFVGDSPENLMSSGGYNPRLIDGPYTYLSKYKLMSTIYTRRLTFLPKIKISQPLGQSFVKGGYGDLETDGFEINNLKIENTDSFKPWKYFICPYTLDLPDNELSFYYNDMFEISPHTVEEKTTPFFRCFFNFVENGNAPEPKETIIGSGSGASPLLKVGRTGIKSFVNEINVTLKSAVNNRTNIDNGHFFRRRYSYISPHDFYLKKIGSNAQDVRDITLRLYMKTFFHFVLKEDCDITDYIEYYGNGSLFSVSEKDDGQGGRYTSIESNRPLFIQFFLGSYEGKSFTKIHENILANSFLYLEINGLIYKYKILGNSDTEIRLEGRHYVDIMSARAFCVGFFNPTRAFFTNDSKEGKIVKLSRSSINNNGELVFNPIPYNTYSIDGVDSIRLVDEGQNFVLSKNIDLFGLDLE